MLQGVLAWIFVYKPELLIALDSITFHMIIDFFSPDICSIIL